MVGCRIAAAKQAARRSRVDERLYMRPRPTIRCDGQSKMGAPEIVARDVPEASLRAKSMPSLTLKVVPSRCA